MNVPADPDSDPSLSNSPMSYPSDSSDGEYSKKMRCMKENKKNCQNENSFNDPIKKCAKLTAKLVTAAQKSKIIKFKFDDYLIHWRGYLLSFMNSLLKQLSLFKEIYMFLIDYPSIRGEDLPDH